MRLLFGLTALVLVGCGGAAGNGAVTDPGVGPEGGTASPDSGPGPLPDSGAPDAKATDGGDGGSTSVKDTRIDPIELGRAWTFNVTTLGFYPACTSGMFTSTTLQSSTVDGKTALHVQSFIIAPTRPGLVLRASRDR